MFRRTDLEFTLASQTLGAWFRYELRGYHFAAVQPGLLSVCTGYLSWGVFVVVTRVKANRN